MMESLYTRINSTQQPANKHYFESAVNYVQMDILS